MATPAQSPLDTKEMHGSSSGSNAQAPVSVGDLSPSQKCRFATKDPTTGCFTYRKCYDCLAQDGCAIGTGGFCEFSDASKRFDYHVAFNWSLVLPAARTTNASGLLDQQRWQFPAADLDYCPTNDTVCADCIQQHYWLNPGDSEDSRFCVGASGCVCVANCNPSLNSTHCPPPKSSHDDEMENSGDAITRALTGIALVLLGFVLLVIILVSICCYSMRKSRRAQQANGAVSRTAPTANRDLASVPYTVIKSDSSPQAHLQQI